MRSTAMQVPVATATTTKTSIKTYLAIAAIGGASFAGAFFMAAGQNAQLALSVAPNAVDIQAAEGDSDVTGLNLMVAARNKAVRITSLTFNVTGEVDGDFSTIQNDLVSSDYLADCSLLRASDGFVYASGAQVVAGQLTFSGLTVNIPKDTGGQLRVACDIQDPATSHANAYGVALSIPVDTQVVAQEVVAGTALAGNQILVGQNDLGVNTQPAQELMINEFASSLSFSRAATPGDVTAIDGQDDVAVLGLDATVDGTEDVTVTALTLTAYGDSDGAGISTIGGEAGSDVNDYIESCSIFNGATLLDGPEAPDSIGQTIVFSNVAWTISGDSTENAVLKCNFANTSAPGSVYFSFDLNEITTDVVAEDADGDALVASQLSGSDLNAATNLASANMVTLLDSGSLSVTTSPSTPAADLIATAAADVHVSSLRFTATHEAFNVETLTISEEQAEDDFGILDSVSYTNNIASVKIEYENINGDTVSRTAALAGNEAKFSGLDMYVNANDTQDLKIYVSTPISDRTAAGSATSNEKIRLGLHVDNINDNDYRAVGASSGTALDDDDQGAVGDDAVAVDGLATFVIEETRPTISLSSLSPSGVKVPGRSEALRFNVAAGANEAVVINEILFKANLTDNNGDDPVDWNDCDTDDPALAMDPSDFDLYDVDDLTTTLDLSSSDVHNLTAAEMSAGTNNPWTLLTGSGAMCNSTTAKVGFIRLRLSTPQIVPAGDDRNFALYFDSTGASAANDDTVRFDIPVDPIVAETNFLSASSLNENNLVSNDTTLTVTSGASYAVGDVLCMDTADDGCTAADEKLLVTAINVNDLTVVRGYLNTIPNTNSSNDASDDLDRMPGSLLWKDDGIASHTGSSDDFWGSYLVDTLPLTGGTLIY